jgi:hypothetical protein
MDYNATVTVRNGARKEDVDQWASPTCSFLASAAVLAHRGHNLGGLITYAGVGDSGTTPKYQVRLFSDGRWRTHTVEFNGDLVMKDGKIFDAVPRSETSDATQCEGESWVVILQRAYLQSQGVNWKSASAVDEDGACDPEEVLTALTGRRTIQYDAGWLDYELDAEDRLRIKDALSAGKAVVAGTFDDADDLSTERLVAQHAYSVLSWYTRSDGVTMFVVRNPWGVDGGTDKNGDTVIQGVTTLDATDDGLIHLTWDDFKRSMEDYWING